MYTDPDGNNPLIGALIGGVSYTLGVAFSKGGFKNWDWFGFASSVVVGAMTSGFASELGAGLSAASNISAVGKAAIQVGAYSAWGGATSFMTGGSFVSGAISGGAGSLAGSIFGGLKPGWQIGASALAGGIGAELSGGDFWRGAATSGIIAGFNHAAHSMAEKIAQTAEKYIDADDWAYDKKKDNFGLMTNKCNKFVSDILNEAGASTYFERHSVSYDLVPLKKQRPYMAGEWGDENLKIRGWKIVKTPRRGDIVAYKHSYSDATGHVAIMNSSKTSIGANA